MKSSASSPPPSQKAGQWGQKSQPPNHALGPLASSPHPEAPWGPGRPPLQRFQGSQKLLCQGLGTKTKCRNKRCSPHTIAQEMMTVSGALCQTLGARGQPRAVTSQPSRASEDVQTYLRSQGLLAKEWASPPCKISRRRLQNSTAQVSEKMLATKPVRTERPVHQASMKWGCPRGEHQGPERPDIGVPGAVARSEASQRRASVSSQAQSWTSTRPKMR